MPDFATIVERFLDESFALDPVDATTVGRHEHDDRWPDLSEGGRIARLGFCDRWSSELTGIDDATWSADEQIDRDRLLLFLESTRFAAAELRPESWDPLDLVYLFGSGLFALLSREFAPLAVRLGSVAGRLSGIPEVLAAARAQLGGLDGRPVSRLHTETALADFPGVVDLAHAAVATAEAAAPDDPEVATLLPRLRAAAGRAEAAVDSFLAHLESVVLPASEGEGRLGRDLYARRLQHLMADPSLTPERVLAEAERAFDAVRAAMVRLSRELWPTWRPAEAPPSDEGRLVRGVLDAIAADHPTADALLDECRSALRGIEAFCQRRDVIGLASEPLEIAWTPRFLRSFANAMLDAPGPFDRAERTFFFITPPDVDWPPERRESYLREQNRRQLAIVTIHEAVPGHYLQISYGNRAPSRVRSVFGDSMYAEGWAVYVTQVMIDLGFAADDPALMLAHWKYFLRAATNAILDVRTHTAGLTEAEAIELMVVGAFQEEAEAHAKWRRARLTSAQLSTYFVGSMAFWDLERAVRVQRAAASGVEDAAAAVPQPQIVGGLGETPGFRYRAHLESVISTGNLPLPLLRRAIAGG